MTNLAFIWLDVRVDNHVSLERLFLHKTLEAHVALVGPNVGVDEDVTLHVGQQGELTTTDATLVLLHPLKKKKTYKLHHERCPEMFGFKTSAARTGNGMI